jgi:hypothetical protein
MARERKGGGKDNRLRFRLGEVRITVDLPRHDREGTPMALSDWLLFSPTELRVIRLLYERGPLTRDALCQKLDESPDGRLKGILATLVGRHVLLVTGDGYALNGPPEYRERVRAWLESVREEEEGA